MIIAQEGTGLLLAGGESRRMGRDKALMEWRGIPLMMHVRTALASRFTRLLLSAPRARYHEPGLPVVEDTIPGAGPLAGVHAALTVCGTPFVFVVACDMPLVLPEMIDAVLQDAEPGRMTVAGDGTRVQPLFGVYPAAAAGLMHRRLIAGQYSLLDLLNEMRGTVVDLSAWKGRLVNINTPEDFPF
jgi:molybdenum cofactor guanylyltransferase